jgi:predicted molibdopterin-dependent oxidoreductase YjgC
MNAAIEQDTGTIHLTIDGRRISSPRGKTILEVCRNASIFIPTLCYDERLEASGGCRLCLVEVKGVPKPLPACTTPADDGMDIVTDNETLLELRRMNLGLILSNHPNDCMWCEKAGDCELQTLAYRYNVKPDEYAGERWNLPIREDNPFITFEPNKCISCARCVRICNEVVMADTIQMVYRGFRAMPDTAYGEPRTLKNCEFCGQCVSTCPTGALTDRKGRGLGRTPDVKKVKTTCSYCGTGCNFYLHVKDDRVIKVSSAYDAPVNRGNLCIKGRYGYDFIHHPDRIKTPLIKKQDGGYREATWDEALDLIATKFKELIATHGPGKVGAFSSSRCTNEENYLLSKWVRCAFGSNNVDNCARV